MLCSSCIYIKVKLKWSQIKVKIIIVVWWISTFKAKSNRTKNVIRILLTFSKLSSCGLFLVQNLVKNIWPPKNISTSCSLPVHTQKADIYSYIHLHVYICESWLITSDPSKCLSGFPCCEQLLNYQEKSCCRCKWGLLNWASCSLSVIKLLSP